MDLALALWRINPDANPLYNADRTAIVEWRGPGQQPTAQQLTDAWTAYLAEQTQKTTTKTQTLAALLTAASSAEGKTLTQLTAGEQRALLACLLYAAGGLDGATLTVQPLDEWVT